MKIEFVPPASPSGTTVILTSADARLGERGQAIDAASGGALTRALGLAGEGIKRGRAIELVAPSGVPAERLVVLSLGQAGEASRLELETVGGSLATALAGLGVTQATVVVEDPGGVTAAPADLAIWLATGVALRSYRFDRYRTSGNDDDDPKAVLAELTFQLPEAVAVTAATAAWPAAEAVIDGVGHGRDLVSEPANVLSPEAFADQCRELGEATGLAVEILGPAELRAQGMNALLGVAQGSVRDPFVVVLRWSGGAADAPPVALVGKGVCFDSGGLSLKPAGGMEEMKWDMGGAGAVFGAMKAIARRRARANVVGVLGLTENMPSGSAQRPGDVVTTMAGLTVEVVNTDAEGRLVLADVLHFTKERFRPRLMVDLATLTGAVVVALGHEHAGLFTPDDGLAAELSEVGAAVGEPLWRMPLGDAYAKHIRSDIADIKNVGRAREAGASAGAVFLQRFVGEVPWVHLDIAGVAWSKQDLGLAPKGATGFGIRLLDRLIANHYEA